MSDEAFDELFEKFDQNGDGKIQKNEAVIFFHDLLKKDASKKTLVGITQELTKKVSVLKKGQSQEESIKKIVNDLFKTYDIDNSGDLDKSELRTYFKNHYG